MSLSSYENLRSVPSTNDGLTSHDSGDDSAGNVVEFWCISVNSELDMLLDKFLPSRESKF